MFPAAGGVEVPTDGDWVEARLVSSFPKGAGWSGAIVNISGKNAIAFKVYALCTAQRLVSNEFKLTSTAP
jgi:hypothetical protein